MLRSLIILRGYIVLARDGEMGKVDDILFEDTDWSVRYLVINTEGWLAGRKILLPPKALQRPDWASEKFPVDLTRKKIEKSPPLDKHAPVSRQHEEELYAYYGWMPYWIHGGVAEHAVREPIPLGEGVKEHVPSGAGPRKEKSGDPHLRSVREVVGYDIGARDGEIGKLDDFIVDDEKWRIRHFIVDTHKWIPGRKVLLPVEMIKNISWERSLLEVGASRKKIEKSPEFDPSETVNSEYEEVLYDYYGRPHYLGQTRE